MRGVRRRTTLPSIAFLCPFVNRKYNPGILSSRQVSTGRVRPESTLARTNFALNVTEPGIWGSIVTRDSPKPGRRPNTTLGQPPIRFMSESASVVSPPAAPVPAWWPRPRAVGRVRESSPSAADPRYRQSPVICPRNPDKSRYRW